MKLNQLLHIFLLITLLCSPHHSWCNSTIQDHFKKSINSLDKNLTSINRDNIKNDLQNCLSELIEKNELSTINTLKQDFEQYKKEALEKKEKISTSFRYVLAKMLSKNHPENQFEGASPQCIFAASVLQTMIEIAPIVVFSTLFDPMDFLDSSLPLTKSAIVRDCLAFGLLIVGVSASLPLRINKILEGSCNKSFDVINSKIEFIDELLALITENKSSIIRS